MHTINYDIKEKHTRTTNKYSYKDDMNHSSIRLVCRNFYNLLNSLSLSLTHTFMFPNSFRDKSILLKKSGCFEKNMKFPSKRKVD